MEQKSPILTPGVANFALLGGDGEVARGDELAAGCRGHGVHLRDHRLRDAVNRLHHHRAHVEQLIVERGVASDHLAEVVPGRERGAGALDHDRPDVGVRADGSSARDQLLHQPERERVPLLRPVERDRRGRAVARHE